MFPTLSPLDIYFSLFCFFLLFACEPTVKRARTHTLMQFCMSAVYLSYLFSEVLLSPSYAVTEVGLFIVTMISLWMVLFFLNCTSFLVWSSAVCPDRPQQHCMWLRTGGRIHTISKVEIFENVLTDKRYNSKVGYVPFLLSPATFHFLYANCHSLDVTSFLTVLFLRDQTFFLCYPLIHGSLCQRCHRGPHTQTSGVLSCGFTAIMWRHWGLSFWGNLQRFGAICFTVDVITHLQREEMFDSKKWEMQ